MQSRVVRLVSQLQLQVADMGAGSGAWRPGPAHINRQGHAGPIRATVGELTRLTAKQPVRGSMTLAAGMVPAEVWDRTTARGT